jgi:N-acetyl-gamma-glutamyl-phosphate reductase
MIAGVIGGAGYAGSELVRLLQTHKNIDSINISSTSLEGESIASVYPNFLNIVNVKLQNAESVIKNSDVVFAALPNCKAEPYAVSCAKKGIPFIDMSADFRFDTDEETYNAWYGKPYSEKDLHKDSIYGLCELNRNKIKERAALSECGKKAPLIIGNPGCYPTCTSLAAMPSLAKCIAGNGTIIIDAASGITGGGREPQKSYHFPECYDSFTAYKVGAHRHTPEISRNFFNIEHANRHIIFTPHLSPMNRGILATLYIPLADKYKLSALTNKNPLPPAKEIEELTDNIRSLYNDFYKNEKFIRILPKGFFAATNRVRLSNYCDISVHIDTYGTTLIITAAIDNMVKGAAGQAVQNMNIIFNFEEDAGLLQIPAMF